MSEQISNNVKSPEINLKPDQNEPDKHLDLRVINSPLGREINIRDLRNPKVVNDKVKEGLYLSFMITKDRLFPKNIGVSAEDRTYGYTDIRTIIKEKDIEFDKNQFSSVHGIVNSLFSSIKKK